MVFRRYRTDDFPVLSDMIKALYREDPGGEPMDESKIASTVNVHRAYPDRLDMCF